MSRSGGLVLVFGGDGVGLGGEEGGFGGKRAESSDMLAA